MHTPPPPCRASSSTSRLPLLLQLAFPTPASHLPRRSDAKIDPKFKRRRNDRHPQEYTRTMFSFVLTPNCTTRTSHSPPRQPLPGFQGAPTPATKNCHTTIENKDGKKSTQRDKATERQRETRRHRDKEKQDTKRAREKKRQSEKQRERQRENKRARAEPQNSRFSNLSYLVTL